MIEYGWREPRFVLSGFRGDIDGGITAHDGSPQMARLKPQAGSELIEFAVVLPLLLILMFGIVDFSLALYDKAVVTNASREGARAAIVATNPRPDLTAIQGVVANYCQTYLVNFGGAAPVVTASGLGGGSGSPLTVQVQYFYNFAVISRLIPSLGSLNLTSTTVMRLE
jgi:Flp pilus assembly protein TadG